MFRTDVGRPRRIVIPFPNMRPPSFHCAQKNYLSCTTCCIPKQNITVFLFLILRSTQWLMCSSVSPLVILSSDFIPVSSTSLVLYMVYWALRFPDYRFSFPSIITVIQRLLIECAVHIFLLVPSVFHVDFRVLVILKTSSFRTFYPSACAFSVALLQNSLF